MRISDWSSDVCSSDLQILASHPLVEGLGELFELQNSVTRIVGANPRTAWPETIANLTANELRALGQRYLSSTRRHRRTNRPFFTDNMPPNWQFIGLIHLIRSGDRRCGTECVSTLRSRVC